MTIAKSLPERFAHALGYEALALLLCVPVASWLMDLPPFDIGMFAALVALIALLWNMLFNTLFEYLERRHGIARTFRVRLIHATAFEIGLILVVVPLGAWWLQIGWWEAFVLDIGLIAFYFPYTLAYNWLYDTARAAWLARSRGDCATPAA